MAATRAKVAPVEVADVAPVGMPSRGSPVEVRIGGTDEAPEWRSGEVTKTHPLAVLVYLRGQYDPGLDPTVKRAGHPARSGEAIVLSPVAEGAALGQFRRP